MIETLLICTHHPGLQAAARTLSTLPQVGFFENVKPLLNRLGRPGPPVTIWVDLGWDGAHSGYEAARAARRRNDGSKAYLFIDDIHEGDRIWSERLGAKIVEPNVVSFLRSIVPVCEQLGLSLKPACEAYRAAFRVACREAYLNNQRAVAWFGLDPSLGEAPQTLTAIVEAAHADEAAAVPPTKPPAAKAANSRTAANQRRPASSGPGLKNPATVQPLPAPSASPPAAASATAATTTAKSPEDAERSQLLVENAHLKRQVELLETAATYFARGWR